MIQEPFYSNRFLNVNRSVPFVFTLVFTLRGPWHVSTGSKHDIQLNRLITCNVVIFLLRIYFMVYTYVIVFYGFLIRFNKYITWIDVIYLSSASLRSVEKWDNIIRASVICHSSDVFMNGRHSHRNTSLLFYTSKESVKKKTIF